MNPQKRPTSNPYPGHDPWKTTQELVDHIREVHGEVTRVPKFSALRQIHHNLHMKEEGKGPKGPGTVTVDGPGKLMPPVKVTAADITTMKVELIVPKIKKDN